MTMHRNSPVVANEYKGSSQRKGDTCHHHVVRIGCQLPFLGSILREAGHQMGRERLRLVNANQSPVSKGLSPDLFYENE